MTAPQPALAAFLIAAATAVGSFLGLLSLNTGAAFTSPPFAAGLTPGIDEAAYRALMPPARLDEAEAKARQALMLSPYQNNPRLRLAYVNWVRDGKVGPAALSYFTQSYELVPIDADVGAWRIRFGLEHWPELTPEARLAVYKEAMAFARVGSNDVNVREILKSIRNPSGRLAAALWLHSLEN